jgi:hypothetical protein
MKTITVHDVYKISRFTDTSFIFICLVSVFAVWPHNLYLATDLKIIILLLAFTCLLPFLKSNFHILKGRWCHRCRMYEVVSKIFRTGAAIYTAVLIVQTICTKRPNC